MLPQQAAVAADERWSFVLFCQEAARSRPVWPGPFSRLMLPWTTMMSPTPTIGASQLSGRSD